MRNKQNLNLAVPRWSVLFGAREFVHPFPQRSASPRPSHHIRDRCRRHHRHSGDVGEVIASITAAREAAMDRTRSEGHNLAVAFADEVTHILDGVAGAMEAVVQRMRAAHGQFNIYGWGHAIPLLSSATVQEGIIGPDGRLVSTTLDPAPQPIDLGPGGRISLVGLNDIIRASFTRENPHGPTDIGSCSIRKSSRRSAPSPAESHMISTTLCYRFSLCRRFWCGKCRKEAAKGRIWKWSSRRADMAVISCSAFSPLAEIRKRLRRRLISP